MKPPAAARNIRSTRRALVSIALAIRAFAQNAPVAGHANEAAGEALAKYPAQRVIERGFSRLHFEETQDGVIIPASVNGKPARFIVDTGAGLSAMSESLARSLAVEIHDDRFPITDFAGKKFECRLGIARELTVGRFRAANVPFCVMVGAGPTNAPGVVGMPVLLALETMRWGREKKTFEIGFRAARRNPRGSNLYFAGAGVAVRAKLGGKEIALDLDTGNDRTMLYPEFTGSFADEMKHAGPKKPHAFQGLGEGIAIDSVELPELKLKIAGESMKLSNVPVFLEPMPLPSQCQRCYGILGLDLLDQARAVTLDFKAMKLTLRP